MSPLAICHTLCYTAPSEPVWWNGRHDRLKICCARACLSSSLRTGITCGLYVVRFFYSSRKSQFNPPSVFRKSIASVMCSVQIVSFSSMSAIVRASFRQELFARAENEYVSAALFFCSILAELQCGSEVKSLFLTCTAAVC